MNNLYLDVLHLRRPPLNYVTPAICDAVFSSTSFPTLILDALPVKKAITGLHIRFLNDSGDVELTWDNYPGAICYSIYKLNDANDPFGAYTIIAECVTDPIFRPEDPDNPNSPDDPVCYIVTAITLEGETAFSDPACTGDDDVEEPEPPDDGGCISNLTPLPDAELGVEYSVTFLPVGPAAGPLWTITGGAAPDGLTLALGTGVFSGIPTEDGEFDFTVRLTKDGGGFCEKAFHLTVTGSCCLENIVNVPTAAPIQGICFAADDNRFVGSVGSNPGDDDIVFIDADTDTILSTISDVGGFPQASVYCPVNNRVYLNSFGVEIMVINPTTMSVVGTIPYPVGIQVMFNPTYDFTNNRIYVSALTTTSDVCIVSIDPTSDTASILVTEVAPPPGQVLAPGKTVAHCSLNNQIYMPVGYFDGVSTSVEIYKYSIAGGDLGSIVIADGTSFDGDEQIFWNEETEYLYYMGVSAVNNLNGTRVINPVDDSTVTLLDGSRAFCVSPNCNVIGIVKADGGVLELLQYSSEDHTLICSTVIGSVFAGSFQIAAATNGKIYAPDYSGNQVRVLRPPE